MHKLMQYLQYILPNSCIVCGQAANRDYSICKECEHELPRFRACCRHCGVELSGELSHNSCCSRCLLCPPNFDSCVAAFPYVSPINKLLTDFKFSARFDIGYSLSRVLARSFNAHYVEASKPELLLPVPLHPSRLLSRGFNQANEISNILSKHCQVPSSLNVLSKTRITEPQTSMASAKARKTNLRNAFRVNKISRLDGIKHIAIVDDVVTTMATAEAISRTLREQLDCRIDVWSLARASR